jgi:hypothetical protein
VVLAFAQLAPPAISQMGVVNTASQMPPVLPGGAVAPGSRIHILGVRLGPGTVELKQSATVSKARILSASAGKIEAILPATLTPGPADLTVSFDGQRSEPAAINVAARAFGISEFKRHGNLVTLRGTGLGVNPAVADVQVFVGNRPVRSVRYAGPDDCCDGMDTITFELPADAIHGCDVPVQVVMNGTHASNVKLFDIEDEGHRCNGAWIRDAVSHAQTEGLVLLLRIAFRADFEKGPMKFFFDAAAIEFAARAIIPALPAMGTCNVTTGVFEVSNIRYGAPAQDHPRARG